ncbi:hypothetical protein [Alloactinosynnema sp. L-07]|nr:hypothetical protein [Alloactinosynnema sp. L-07]
MGFAEHGDDLVEQLRVVPATCSPSGGGSRAQAFGRARDPATRLN